MLAGEIGNLIVLRYSPYAMTGRALGDDVLELRLIDSEDWRAWRYDEESGDERRTKFGDHRDHPCDGVANECP